MPLDSTPNLNALILVYLNVRACVFMCVYSYFFFTFSGDTIDSNCDFYIHVCLRAKSLQLCLTLQPHGL